MARSLVRSALVAALLLAGVGARAETVPGHVVVRLRHDRAPRILEGETHLRAIGDGMHIFHTRGDVDDLVRRLAADPEVEWAEPEHVRRIDGLTTNDPRFGDQWALPLIHVTDAWSRTMGLATVTVAIVDTGILPHPDLVGRFAGGYDFVSDPANGGDGDGRDADPSDPGTSDPSSSSLHGLHVTGILAAHDNNALGIAGVDWNCVVLPVRVLGVNGGSGTDADIADGIRWAAGVPVAGVPDNATPAQVINLSFGGPGLSNLLQAAVDAAHARGALVVASAGNDAVDTGNYAPAALNHVIAVGAVDQHSKLAPYSNRGARVDIMAPGGDLAQGPTAGILSTIKLLTDGYDYIEYHGTSQAAPHVSGALSLMLAASPGIDPDNAQRILIATADPAAQCAEGCGAGLVNVDAAVAAAMQQAICDPVCAANEVCRNKACVKIDPPFDLEGSCACSLAARGWPTGSALVIAALAIAFLRRQRRRHAR